MTTSSKRKPYPQRILSKTDARRFRETINKSVWIVSNQYQINMSLSIKNVAAMNFVCRIIKVFHL